MRAPIVMTVAAGLVALAVIARGEGTSCGASTQQCLDIMTASCASRGWLGVELSAQPDGSSRVRRVVEKSPAEAAGLQAGDRIVAIDGIRLGDASNEGALVRVQAGMKPGTSVTYSIERGGETRSVQVRLAAMPDSVRHQLIGEHMVEHARALAPPPGKG